MTTFVFANNINADLASSVSSSATTITLSSGANLPTSIPSGEVLAITLNDAATQQIFEVVYATAISGTTLTVQRAQEGTTPQAWAAGDYVFSGPTAGQMQALQAGIGSGVTSWNARTGAVDPATGDYTWTMIGGAFPYVASFNSRIGAVVLSDSDVVTALGYTPGTVTAVTVTNANGVSATVANQGTTPQLTLALGAITPTSISCSGAVSANSVTAFGSAQIGSLAVGPALNLSSTPSFGGLAIGANLEAPLGEVDLVSGNGGAAGAGFNLYSRLASGALSILASITPSGIASASGISATTGNFAAGVTCVTWNATGSDRRLKRNIRKIEPRPLHRSVPFVSFERKVDGSLGRGAIAQRMQKVAPEHVHTFDFHGKKRLNVDYGMAAYEQATWAGIEIDGMAKLIEKQAKSIAKLEARLAKLERRI